MHRYSLSLLDSPEEQAYVKVTTQKMMLSVHKFVDTGGLISSVILSAL